MPNEFQYDVFLSHSAKDKAVVRAVAERRGLRLTGWNYAGGDRGPASFRGASPASDLLAGGSELFPTASSARPSIWALPHLGFIETTP